VQSPQAGTAVIEGIVTRGRTEQPSWASALLSWETTDRIPRTKTDAKDSYFFRASSRDLRYRNAGSGRCLGPNPSSGATVRLMVSDQQRVGHNNFDAGGFRMRIRILGENREPLAEITLEILRLAFRLARTTGVAAPRLEIA
jgi:hypothetical protein